MRLKYIIPIFLILVPVIEIVLFIEVGSRIGTLNTIILIFSTAIVGIYLIKNGRFSYFAEIQSSLQQGIMPQLAIFSGMFFFLAGFLLIIPGFFTDSIGVLLLFKSVRHLITSKLMKPPQNYWKSCKKSRSIIDVDHKNIDE